MQFLYFAAVDCATSCMKLHYTHLWLALFALRAWREKKTCPVGRGLILKHVLRAHPMGRAIKINYFDRLMITTFLNDF